VTVHAGRTADPWRRSIATATATIALALLVGACSSGGGSTDATTPAKPQPARIDDVAPAIAAVEAARGGRQRYTEINANEAVVNLFVAQPDGTEIAYVYRDGKLDPPAEPTAQQPGATAFDLSSVDLSKVGGFHDLLKKDLPDAVLRRLTLVQIPGKGLNWVATVVNSKGSPIDVVFSPAGALVGAVAGP
jgi:hypothetical protein